MIRKATIEDASRLAEIFIFAKRVTYRPIFKDDKVSFDIMQVLPLAQSFIQNPKLLENMYVFDDEFVKALVNISFDEDKAEIKELYTDPFFQGQKIGGELFRFAQNLFKEKGYSEIVLWVLEKNKTARAFYEKSGFKKTDERELEEGTNEYKLKYIKEI